MIKYEKNCQLQPKVAFFLCLSIHGAQERPSSSTVYSKQTSAASNVERITSCAFFPWKHTPGTRCLKQLNLSCFSKTAPFFPPSRRCKLFFLKFVLIRRCHLSITVEIPRRACMPSPLQYIKYRQATGEREKVWLPCPPPPFFISLGVI